MGNKATNGQVLQAINGIDKKLGVVLNKMKNVENTVIKHEKLIYGKPEEMGKGGLLHKQGEQDGKIKGLGDRVDATRSTFVMIWTGIFALVQVSFSAIKHFFSGNN